MFIFALHLLRVLVQFFGRFWSDLVTPEVFNFPDLLGTLELDENNDWVHLRTLQTLCTGSAHVDYAVEFLLKNEPILGIAIKL